MFNSIKILDKAFDILNYEERKLNYEYDPRSAKKDESWKRHLFFFELKRDFIKDIKDFGFCPYIQKPYDEQRKDKNIMKYTRKGNLSRTDYIKNLYKKITNNSNNDKNNKIISSRRMKYALSPRKNNSMKDSNYKVGNTKNIKNKNTFLMEIYNKINHKNQNNNMKFKKLLNSSKANVDNTELLNHMKYNKNDNSHDENSFIYEPETSNQRYNDNYFYKAYKEKNNNTNNKNDSSSDNDSEISTSNKNMILLNDKSTLYSNAKNEVKKNGWRMTTSMETGQFLKSSKVLFSNTKNFSKYKNEKINKNKKYKLKRSISNINIIPKSIINNNSGNRKKYHEKSYRLFSHLKKMKNMEKDKI